jgi:hypothetical protein
VYKTYRGESNKITVVNCPDSDFLAKYEIQPETTTNTLVASYSPIPARRSLRMDVTSPMHSSPGKRKLASPDNECELTEYTKAIFLGKSRLGLRNSKRDGLYSPGRRVMTTPEKDEPFLDFLARSSPPKTPHKSEAASNQSLLMTPSKEERGPLCAETTLSVVFSARNKAADMHDAGNLKSRNNEYHTLQPVKPTSYSDNHQKYETPFDAATLQ